VARRPGERWPSLGPSAAGRPGDLSASARVASGMGSNGQDVTLSGAPDGKGLAVGEVPRESHLVAYSESASRDGRRLVVGAVVTDGAGRVFVQRRSRDRELFPGAWDVVGGHAETGEDALAALRREVLEETGWRVLTLGPIVELIDWEANGVS